MVKINYKQKIRLGGLTCGDTFLYHGVLGIVVKAWCDECARFEYRAIELETGMDMGDDTNVNSETIVEKVDIEINIL